MVSGHISRYATFQRATRASRVAVNWLFLAILLAFACHGEFAIAEPPRPNIVFIMADDLGINDLGVYGQNARKDAGQPYISTPNIDALAKTGVRFTEMYTPATVCAPTRASVLTGFHGGHVAVDSNGLNNNGGNALRGVDYSFAQGLQTSNYTTGAFGKWGSGMDGTLLSPRATGDSALINHPNPQVTHPDSTPAAKGFDEFYGYLNHIHAHNYYVEYLWEHDKDNSGDVGGMQVDWSPTTSDYSHDLIAARSIQFIKDHAADSEPFFMYGEYTVPHNDYNPPNDEFLQQYLDQGLSGNQADYGAMVSRLDANVGEIVQTLRDPNGDGNEADSVLENTLIIFATDNGPTGGANGWFDSNGIYRGTKNDVYEGAHRTPFIVSWANQIVPSDSINGDVNDTHSGQLTDLFATFSELAGVEVPVGLDGRSMAGLFTGGEVDTHDYLIWEDRPSGDWAIRMQQYKLLKTGNNSVQLYDLANDPSETTNLLNSPTTEQAAIATLLQQIALDEGVESDVGNGGAQNTHIVQYKTWAPSGGSTDFESAGNWSGGSEFNTRGTPANNFATGPANNWIATIANATSGPQEIQVDGQSEVLAFELEGPSDPITMKIMPNASLMARNGARIGPSATVELDGGELKTVRTIEVQSGGTLAGRGSISTGYDTSGTPFTLEAHVENDGRLDLGGAQAAAVGGESLVEVLANGGFELGTGNAFAAVDAWFNFSGDDTLTARNGTNPASGAFRGILGLNSNGVDQPSPAQVTSHSIALGDVYTLEFEFGGANGWDEGTDQFQVTIYYEDAGTPVDLFSWDVTPQLNFGVGYDPFSVTSSSVEDASAIGKPLLVRFESIASGGEFASIDNVSLKVGEPSSAINVLTIDGSYLQTADGTAVVDLWGDGGIAGVDFDQLVVTSDATLDGTLEVSLADGFEPDFGAEFPIILANEISGEFSQVVAPELDGGRWEMVYTTSTATLTVMYAADFNSDGTVDGADLSLWQSGHGTQGTATVNDGDADGDGDVDGADLLVWQRQFGNTILPSAPSIAVPELSSSKLLLFGTLVFMVALR